MKSGEKMTSSVSRREALAALGASAGVVLVSAQAPADESPVRTPLPGAAVCILSPQLDEGPFYLDEKLVRSDIREDRDGVPLRLILQVIEGSNCGPIAKARVDIWHCDAVGRYSGVDHQGDDQSESTAKATFLRGTQLTDAFGVVTFDTIYPGWYPGRTTHIHFKIILDGRNVLTCQTFMPDALNEFLYLNAGPYQGRARPRDTVNSSDFIANNGEPDHATFCSIKEETGRYVASLVVGVDRTAVAFEGPKGMPPGAPPPPFGRGLEGAPVRPRGSLIPGI
jgi:protocatechuate 3,4-dioxygenase beta subunit